MKFQIFPGLGAKPGLDEFHSCYKESGCSLSGYHQIRYIRLAKKFMEKTISKDARKDFIKKEVHIDTTDKVVVYSETFEFRFLVKV